MALSERDHHRSRNGTPHFGPSSKVSAGDREQPFAVHQRSGNVDQSSTFVEDRKGDRQNLAYQSLDRRAVPRYRWAGNGALIGLSSNHRITSRSESRWEIENVENDATRRLRKQSLLSNIIDDDDGFVTFRPDGSSENDLDMDFLRFDHRRSRKRRRLSPEGEARNEEDAESYESSSEPEPEEVPEEVTEDAFEAFKRDPVHKRQMELSRATVDHPEDASAWFALIDFQHMVFKNQTSSGHSTLHSSRNLADIKISLYEKALSYVKDPRQRHALVLGLMREGGKVWDTEKQSSQWQSVLGRDSSLDLWTLYVNFVQSNPVKFSFDGCLEIYRQWFQKLLQLPDGHEKDSRSIYALLRVTLLLWEAGFTERAAGIWQAILEYNFFCPTGRPADELLLSFEEFWDSEVARIGEEDSHGWSSGANSEVVARCDKRFQPKPIDFVDWAAAESTLEQASGLPARALDDVNEEDPFRMILFSDIKDFLFSVATATGLRLLEDAFLLFVGLPRLSTLPESKPWERDPFVYHIPLAAESPLFDGGRDDAFDFDMRFPEVFCASKNLATPSASILRSTSGQAIVVVYFDFVRKVISQLAERAIERAPDELMLEYYISLEAGLDVKMARKLAKSFLKRKSDSLALYDAYATLEARLANWDAGERVWSTALSMRLSFREDAEANSFFLWRSWAYSYMCQKKFDYARRLLSMLPNATVDLSDLHQDATSNYAPSAAHRLKAEQYIKARIEASRLRGHWQATPAMIDVLAFHHYLNSNLRIGQALEAYDYGMSIVLATAHGNDVTVLEKVHEQRARFIYAHVVTFSKDFRPRDLSVTLQESLRTFPDNFTLLILNHYFAQRSGVVERLRQTDRRITDREDENNAQPNVIPSIFEVLVEVHRPSYAGSTDHSIRSVFRRVTAPEAAGHNCIGVWKAFCQWELSLESESRSRGAATAIGKGKERKAVIEIRESYYDSLRACPWSKDLCLHAFIQPTLGDVIGEDGLKRVYQNMLDRGMRLRLDISDGLF